MLLRLTIIELHQKRTDEYAYDEAIHQLYAQFDNKKKLQQELLEAPPSLKSLHAQHNDLPVPPPTPTFEPPKIAPSTFPKTFETPQASILPLTIFAADRGTGPTNEPSLHPSNGTTSKTVKAQEWLPSSKDERPPPEPPPRQPST